MEVEEPKLVQIKLSCAADFFHTEINGRKEPKLVINNNRFSLKYVQLMVKKGFI